jgi:hypothetical protein
MNRLPRVLARRRANEGSLVLAALLLVASRFGLRWLPRPVVSRLLRRSNATAAHVRGPSPFARRLIRAVERVGRHIPGCENCLVQALAVHVWMRRHGGGWDLRIGVAKTTEGTLIAHAWIESGGEIVTGDRPDLHTYHVLQRRSASTDGRDRGPLSF